MFQLDEDVSKLNGQNYSTLLFELGANLVLI